MHGDMVDIRSDSFQIEIVLEICGMCENFIRNSCKWVSNSCTCMCNNMSIMQFVYIYMYIPIPCIPARNTPPISKTVSENHLVALHLAESHTHALG